MAGFKSETQAGVRGAFAGIGKIVGVAFTGIAVGELVKSAVGAAADIQKQMEVVRYEFGRSAEGLLQFADTTGVALGDANRYTDAASARFGLLFKSLGVGQVKAALMTRGFEQLALSVNAIRGGGSEGAARLLQQIVLAAAGNTRGLKQMGIVVDSTSEKIAAMKLGLIQSMSQALTPAVKTQAIYAIATAHLGETMALAQKHSGDLANVQARLSAEWMVAKEALGNALLPAITHGITALADWLQRMNKSGRLAREFGTAAHVAAVGVHVIFTAARAAINVWNGFARAVGGGRHALLLLVAAFAVNKIRKFGSAIRTDVNAAIAQTRKRIAATAAAQKTASTQAIAQESRVGAASRTASAEAQAATRKSVAVNSSATKKMVVQYRTVDGAVVQYGRTVEATSAETATAIKTSAVEGEAASTGLWASMKVGAITTAAVIESALVSTGIGALMVGIGIAVAWVLTHWDTVKRWTVALGAVISRIWHGLTGIIIGAAKMIGGGIVSYLIFPMKEFIDVAASAVGWIPYIGDGVKSAAHAVDSLFSSMKNLVGSGKDQLVRGAQTIGTAGQAWSEAMAKSASSKSAKQKLHDAGKAGGTALAEGLGQGLNGGVTGVGKSLDKTLQNVIASAQARMKKSVQDAKDNLVRIGGDLAKTIGKIQAKMGGAAGALAGSPQGKAFAKLKKLIESGAPDFQIARARAALSTQLEGVGKQSPSGPAQQLGGLTAAFNQGKITYAQFTNRLHKILRANGITLAKALKTGGSAFAATYKAQVAALGKQAQAINAVPRSLRGVGGAGGSADIKIVQPLQVIQREQTRVRVATQKAAAKAQAAAQKKAAFDQAWKQVQIAGAHHAARQRAAALTEAKRHTIQLQRIVGITQHGGFARHGRGDRSFFVSRRAIGPAGPAGPLGKPTGTPTAGAVQFAAEIRASAARTHQIINGHRVAVVQAILGLRTQTNANERAILEAELKVIEPIDRLRSEQARQANHAALQRERLIRSSDRTNTLLRKITKTNVRPLPGYGKQPKGTGSHEARQGATVGSRL